MSAPDVFPLPPLAFTARPRPLRAAGAASAWLGFAASLLRAWPGRLALSGLPTTLALFLAAVGPSLPWRLGFLALACGLLAVPLLAVRRAAQLAAPGAAELGSLFDFGNPANGRALAGTLLWSGLFALSGWLLSLPFGAGHFVAPRLAVFALAALCLLMLDWLLLCAFALFLRLTLCHAQPLTEALFAALAAVAKNLPAFLALGVWLAIAAFLLLPTTLGLGLLLWLPLLAGALHAACRDIFLTT
ncbi:MAG: hypothetical protein LBL69_01170 [Zoogloeaceae bacterium]|nr:hypothetical protein [Zoogloeaceae bacterium]